MVAICAGRSQRQKIRSLHGDPQKEDPIIKRTVPQLGIKNKVTQKITTHLHLRLTIHRGRTPSEINHQVEEYTLLQLHQLGLKSVGK